MRARICCTLVGIGLTLAGCMPPPLPQVADVSEPGLEEPTLVAACPAPPPPKIVEVPVPVPMPCQLQAEPLFDAPVAKGKKPKATPVALRSDSPGGINAVQEFAFMEGALYQVYVALNKVTTIRLAPGEFFHQAIIGDKTKWATGELAEGSEGTQRGGAWVSCAEAPAHTNMTVTGSQHLYLIELHCTDSTYHAAVSWRYPSAQGVGVVKGTIPARPAPLAAPAPVVTPDAPSAAQYTMKSNRPVVWLPTHVYDTGVEGKQTYIVFPLALESTEAPVLYVRSAEGTQSIVNYRVQQGYWLNDRIYNAQDLQGKIGGLGTPLTYFVMDAIAEVLELRVGEKHPTIVRITRQNPAL